MHPRRLGLALVVGLPLFGCAVEDVDTEEDDLGETVAELKTARNVGWTGGQKIGAIITCSGEELRLLPGGRSVVHEGGAQVTAKGRPVLVQYSPGAVTGPNGKKYVWIDPDFWGIGRYVEDSGDQQEDIDKKKSTATQELKERFGSKAPSVDDVHDPSKFPPSYRRGWFARDCLEPAKAGDKIPNVSRLTDKFGNGHKVVGSAIQHNAIVGGCLFDDEAHNQNVGYRKDPENPNDPNDHGHITKYWTYGAGVRGGNGVYLSFNTPAARKRGSAPDAAPGGGGMTAMYIPVGDKFTVYVGQERVDDRLDAEPGYSPEALDGMWSFGYYELEVKKKGKHERVYGWVYSKCLLHPPAAAAAFKTESCAGKETNRVYCVDSNPSLPGYTCDENGQLTKLTCASEGRCEFHPNGGGEAAACLEWPN